MLLFIRYLQSGAVCIKSMKNTVNNAYISASILKAGECFLQKAIIINKITCHSDPAYADIQTQNRRMKQLTDMITVHRS